MGENSANSFGSHALANADTLKFLGEYDGDLISAAAGLPCVDKLKFLSGMAIPHHVFGARNAGVPTFVDAMGYKNRIEYPLHALPISSVCVPGLRGLSMGTVMEDQCQYAMDFFTETARYRNVPKPILGDSSCTLSADRTRQMINNGFWVLLEDQSNILQIMGIVSVFTVSEVWKDPARDRVIGWTRTLNLDMSLKPEMKLLRQCDVRFLVHKGSYAFTVDGKACYNQFEVSEPISMYQCVYTPLGWCRVVRMAMGCRYACFVADTILQVLGIKSEGFTSTYVDNFLDVADDRLTLERDIVTLDSRSKIANYVWNETLLVDGKANPTLIRQQVEYLGAELDFAQKKARLTGKTLKKLATIWERKDGWSVMDFIIGVCILVYGTNMLGLKMSKWQPILQLWARAQSRAMLDPTSTKRQFETGSEFMFMLGKWVHQVLKNKWVDVPEQGKAMQADFVLCTDACIWGWGGILMCTSTGQCTVMGGKWNADTLKRYDVSKSSNSEPLGVIASVNTFFNEHTGASVLHIGDNTGTVGAMNKGYSTKEGQILMPYLAYFHPHLRFKSEYYAGELIPADEVSRQLPVLEAKIHRLAKILAVPVITIRDGCG